MALECPSCKEIMRCKQEEREWVCPSCGTEVIYKNGTTYVVPPEVEDGEFEQTAPKDA